MQANTSTSEIAPRSVLVVGGTGGIGGAISRAFAVDGCNVIATGVAHDELAAFQASSEAIEARLLDVTNANEIESLVGGLMRLDVLVNAAGTILRHGAEHEPDVFARVIDVNLIGMMRVCTACRPLLVASGGYVIKGEWRYLEHDWIARQGMYVFEPPGEVHTLVVDDHVDEMIALFHVCGALIYYDDHDRACGHDDVHTKINLCRDHFAHVGLGEDFVDRFIR
ncbi:MAG: SDR family NAD(P)-dependent oxidoreductase [Planctomycetota bacterium]